MEYIIIENSTKKELVLEVNKYIADGWQLQGGLCISGIWYSQAMVKNK